MTCFALANPAGLVVQVQARQRVRGLVRDALHDGDVRGRRRRRSRPCTSCRPSSYPTTYIGYSPTGDHHFAGPVVRPRPARRSPSPISTSTSRGSLGCSAGPPGRVPATTSANRSTSATSSTGTPPAWARESRTSTSARTCELSYAAFAVDGEPAPATRRHVAAVADAESTSVFETICSFEGSDRGESGEFQLGVPVHRRTTATIPATTRRMGRHRPIRAEGARRRQQAGSPVRQGRRNRLWNALALLLPRLLAPPRPE